ncbi:hypothetical protein [Alienimonas chondri]|uniref:DUF304 domain-containing protein n=1 Tax=Alienimonas chondri TaxID=2681879 RepID=A0ABX1VCD0_9PLAN|nr:hypothetical protein [Alienimonas chondri]NNJ25750.1 hypothetical protein [Alienimonas chondri]
MTNEPTGNEVVFEASFEPSRWGRSMTVLGVVGALAVSMLWAAAMVSEQLGRGLVGVNWGELWGGLACSAVPFFLAAVFLAETRLGYARIWFRVTPERAEWERVWWGMRRYGTTSLVEGDGLIDEPGPWFGADEHAAVSARLGGQRVQLARSLDGANGARVRAGIAGVIGVVPRDRPAGPWLTSADPQAPPHPDVQVGHDRRGRPTVTTPLMPRSGAPFRLWIAGGVAIALVAPGAWWLWFLDGSPMTPGLWATWPVGVAAGLAAGAGIGAAPWATVRVTLLAKPNRGDRLAIRTGWGRWRVGPRVRLSGIQAVAAALHHTGRWSLGEVHANLPWKAASRYRRNPTAMLVRPARWDGAEQTAIPLTGRVPHDDPATFAAAAAGAVKALLIEADWNAKPPADWRFGEFTDDPSLT